MIGYVEWVDTHLPIWSSKKMEHVADDSLCAHKVGPEWMYHTDNDGMWEQEYQVLS